MTGIDLLCSIQINIYKAHLLTEKVYRVGSRFILDNGIQLELLFIMKKSGWKITEILHIIHSLIPENARTIVYGGSISVDDSVSGGSYIAYKIIRASEEEGGSKFTASLNLTVVDWLLAQRFREVTRSQESMNSTDLHGINLGKTWNEKINHRVIGNNIHRFCGGIWVVKK